MNTPVDEATIIRRLKAGDRSACAECVRAYATDLYNLILRIVHDPDDAEDVLQETFLHALKAIGQFEERARLSTWLYRIAYNTALMRVRQRRHSTSSLDELLEQDDEGTSLALPGEEKAPEEVILSGELRMVLEKAIGELPQTLRVVFVLRDINQLSTAETAQVLGLSEEAVKSRLLRARQALRQRLAPYLEGESPSNMGGDTG